MKADDRTIRRVGLRHGWIHSPNIGTSIARPAQIHKRRSSAGDGMVLFLLEKVWSELFAGDAGEALNLDGAFCRDTTRSGFPLTRIGTRHADTLGKL